MKVFAVLLLSSLFTLNAVAGDSLDELEIRSMKNAKSDTELSKKIREIENMRTMRLACDMQMASNKLPYSCYEMRKLTKDLKLSSTTWVAKDLDQICLRIAHSTAELTLRKGHLLPKACLVAAKEQIQINQYKTGKVFD